MAATREVLPAYRMLNNNMLFLYLDFWLVVLAMWFRSPHGDLSGRPKNTDFEASEFASETSLLSVFKCPPKDLGDVCTVFFGCEMHECFCGSQDVTCGYRLRGPEQPTPLPA